MNKRGRPRGRNTKVMLISLPHYIHRFLLTLPRGERSKFVSSAIHSAIIKNQLFEGKALLELGDYDDRWLFGD